MFILNLWILPYMLKLYQTNLLTISDITEYSVYADGDGYSDIPLRDTPEGMEVGDEAWAFVYRDASDDVVATMAKAYAQVGECAYLEVVSNGDRGTFLDWGLPKDLLLPFTRQMGKIREGGFYCVYVYLDDDDRPVASMKIHQHLSEDYGDLEINETVDLMISGETDLGFRAVINNEQLGMIYHEELSRPLKIGSRMKGWVQKIREDGKINLNINRLDNDTRNNLEEEILTQLKENSGRLNVSDKSSPDIIYEHFNVSKNNFKRALGNLYKQKLIYISPQFIELVPQD